MLRFTISIVFIVIAGLLQSAIWFNFLGVKPDLILALVLVLLLTDQDWIDRLAFILVGEFMLQFGPIPDIYDLIFLILMVLSCLAFNYINLQQYIALGIVTVVSTVLINVYGHVPPNIILTETAYNLVLVVLIYLAFSTSYGKKVHE